MKAQNALSAGIPDDAQRRIVDALCTTLRPEHARAVLSELQREVERLHRGEAILRLARAHEEEERAKPARTKAAGRAAMDPVIERYWQQGTSTTEQSKLRREAESLRDQKVGELVPAVVAPARARRRPTDTMSRQLESRVVAVLELHGITTTGARNEPAAVVLEALLGRSADPRNRARRAVKRNDGVAASLAALDRHRSKRNG